MFSYANNISYVINSFEQDSFEPHFHEEYSIALVTKGEHKLSIHDNKYKLATGYIRCINPYDLHATITSSWTYINLMPTQELFSCIAKKIFPNKKETELIRLRPLIFDKQATKLFKGVYLNLINNQNSVWLESCIIELLTYLLTHHSLQTVLVSNVVADNKCINNAIEYIDAYWQQAQLNLDQIANAATMSKYHFIREFKKQTGITPAYYLQLKKVNAAKSQLLLDRSLKEIAYDCGFYDQSHFNKVFKRFVGCTPKQVVQRKILL